MGADTYDNNDDDDDDDDDGGDDDDCNVFSSPQRTLTRVDTKGLKKYDDIDDDDDDDDDTKNDDDDDDDVFLYICFFCGILIFEAQIYWWEVISSFRSTFSGYR